MIKYAISTGSLAGMITPELAEVFRGELKLRNLEISFLPNITDTPEAKLSVELTRALLREDKIRLASVHLPFYGGNLDWNPAHPEESKRKKIAEQYVKLIRDNEDLLAPELTLHAGSEGVYVNELSSQHSTLGVEQSCRTIEAVIPLAEEYKFRINVEFLPRSCIGNSAEELELIASRFDPKHVGICLDVNHIMNRWRELPEIIEKLAPRINSFHISDYDGIDEMHWFPGQGVIDWPSVMKAIRSMDHDTLLIFETLYQLGTPVSHTASPLFALRQTESAIWYLENCDEISQRIADFQLPR